METCSATSSPRPTSAATACCPIDVDGVAATFADDLDLLAALQLKWHTRLAGRIEREQMTQPMDLRASVVRAWHRTADELPGIRAILDEQRLRPADEATAEVMRKSAAKEHVLLAVMAGEASVHGRPRRRRRRPDRGRGQGHAGRRTTCSRARRRPRARGSIGRS